MSEEVTAVCFDIDGTLCEYRRTGAEILPIAFERVGIDPFFTDQEYLQCYPEFTDESISIVDLRERCFAALASDRGYDPELGRAVAEAYADERDHGNVRFLPGVREALETVAGRYPLAAVTNGYPAMQRTKLESLGIKSTFEEIVYGGSDAPAKPSAEPFYHALEALDSDPATTLHVGNSVTSDVVGAKRAGLDAVWYSEATRGGTTPDDATTEPDHIIDSMAELPSLLPGVQAGEQA